MRKASQEDAFLIFSSFRYDVITSKRYDDII